MIKMNLRSVLAWSVVAVWCAGALGAVPPKVVIRELPANEHMSVGGDCNRPAVWVDGELRIYESPYPQKMEGVDFPGGVKWYTTGPTVKERKKRVEVKPDREKLAAVKAFGPWFESVVPDEKGNLYAYYHAEFLHEKETKIHPRIGAQVSKDKGVTWKDLGIILDTPEDTDQVNTRLGYGFTGGNGDCSVVLDSKNEYLYLFFSQYGGGRENQGVGMARMKWADRDTPVVHKWAGAAGWTAKGVGGAAKPILYNVGDAHGRDAKGKDVEMDYWWGPAVHYNTYLDRYVVMLNRSNGGDFKNTGADHYYMTSASLEDPTKWDEPAQLPAPLPTDIGEPWYPQVIGTGKGETDKLAGQKARLFVFGNSKWEIEFVRPEK